MSAGPEIEAKFYLRHLGDIRGRVLARGGRLLVSRQLERNWRFDDQDGSLTESGTVLRLRQDSRATLAYKEPRREIEERWEIEFEVDDLHAARALLEALGYHLISGYEKYREVFALGPVEVMLDELPFGCFVEIEGPSLEQVREATQAIGFDWERRVRSSYVNLFQALRRRFQLAFTEATFENFAGVAPIHPQDLQVLEAYLTREEDS